MEDIKVFALDDEGNRIEPKQPEQETNVEQEAIPEVEPQQTEVNDGLREENEEQQNVEKQEESEANDIQEEEVKEPVQEPEQDDNWFLNKLKERYEVEVNSVDDLKNVLSNTETETKTLPEDVEKYLQYRKETGRSFGDFAELQKDWSAVSDEQVIRDFYKQTKPHLDGGDIEHILNEQFSYDAEVDDEKDVRGKKIAYKEALYQARQHFENLKEKYKAPLESNPADLPEDYKEAFSFYNEYKQNTDQEAKLQQERAEVFTKKTNSFFNDEFKGFEFNVGEKKYVFKPGDVSETKKAQSDIGNYISKHLDENGMLKDAATYHKSQFAALNPDAIAKYFYEQGKADATDGIVKETKNIDMTVRDNKVSEAGGTKFRVVESGDEFSFKIRKRN